MANSGDDGDGRRTVLICYRPSRVCSRLITLDVGPISDKEVLDLARLAVANRDPGGQTLSVEVIDSSGARLVEHNSGEDQSSDGG